MNTHHVLTIIGDDKPGLVDLLSQTIADHGGNWHESHLARLAGKFAGVVLISIDPAASEQLKPALAALESRGLFVHLQPAEDSNDETNTDVSSQSAEPIQYLLTFLGPDRSGIVRDVSHALAEQYVNVDDLTTSLTSAPMSGERLFNATAIIRVPATTDTDQLQDNLQQVADVLGLDLTLESLASPSV